MNKKLKEDYIDYLSQICDDEIIIDIASKYIEDLSKLYRNKYFTIEDFQQLNINHKVYNQDIVNDMFKNRKMLTAEEVFYYLFTHHIQKIGFAPPEVIGQRVLGKVIIKSNAILFNKELFTRTPKLKCLEKKYKLNPDFYIDDELSLQGSRVFEIIDSVSTKINHSIQRDNDYNYKYLKKILYHEFSHVFELTTFNNVQYYKFGMNVITNLTNLKIRLPFNLSNLNNETFISHLTGGLQALSEIYNEVFAAKVLRDENKSIVKTKKRSFINWNNVDYSNKYHFMHKTHYQINYEIVKLLNLIMFDKENEEDMYRFNFVNFYKKMNQIEVSPEVLKKLKTFYMILISKQDEKFQDKQYYNEYYDLLKECNTACFIFLLMVGSYYLNSSNFTNKKQSFYQYKLLLQELLVDAINNKIKKQLQDKSVIKNCSYFERLEQTLQTIDNFILYPNEIINHDVPIIRKTEINNMSVKQYADKYKNLEYIQTFNNLIQTVEKYINENSDALTKKQKDMQFFSDQENLDLRYISIKNKLNSPVDKFYANTLNRMDKTLKGIKNHLSEYKKIFRKNSNNQENEIKK